MTRYAIDAGTALRLIREPSGRPPRGPLVGPGTLRSQVLALLYREVRDGGLEASVARTQLDALAGLKIRLLGDRVSRATAWRLATELDWPDIAPAEVLAVAVLQADAIVAADPAIAVAAAGRIRVADYDELVG